MGALQRAHQYHRGGGARAQAVSEQGDRNCVLVQQLADRDAQIADLRKELGDVRVALDAANFSEREAIAKEGETFAALEQERDRVANLANLLGKLQAPPEKVEELTAKLAAEREAHAMTGVQLHSAKEAIIDLMAKESERAADTPLTPPAKVLRILERHGILQSISPQQVEVLGHRVPLGLAAPPTAAADGSSPKASSMASGR